MEYNKTKRGLEKPGNKLATYNAKNTKNQTTT